MNHNLLTEMSSFAKTKVLKEKSLYHLYFKHWLQTSHWRIGKQSLLEPPVETAYKLFSLRPILKKNVFPLGIFYKYISMCSFSLNKFNARCSKVLIL